jgi:hypothetical protein
MKGCGKSFEQAARIREEAGTAREGRGLIAGADVRGQRPALLYAIIGFFRGSDGLVEAFNVVAGCAVMGGVGDRIIFSSCICLRCGAQLPWERLWRTTEPVFDAAVPICRIGVHLGPP